MKSFSKLGLADWIDKTCRAMNMYSPTEVQEQTIPLILSGRDVVASSKTGSGKTACFCLPILHKLAEDPFGVFALVITPVRELASQISDQFVALGHPINVSVVSVFGGRSNVSQSALLASRPHIVIATPGRLAELLRGDESLRGVFKHLQFLVLDEVDRLLNEGFEEDLAHIMNCLPSREKRQTLLFSATLTDSLGILISNYSSSSSGRSPMEVIKVGEDLLSDSVSLKYLFVPRTVKSLYLFYLVSEIFKKNKILIFTSKIRSCQVIYLLLQKLLANQGETEEFEDERNGHDEKQASELNQVVALHSLLDGQKRRDASLGKFRNGKARILIATDVASRGLDIPEVDIVINYEVPRDGKDFIHRAGRTGRASKRGLCISLVSENEVDLVKAAENQMNRKLEEFEGKIEEKSLLKNFSKISRARGEVEIFMSESGFDKKIKKRKVSTVKKRTQISPS